MWRVVATAEGCRVEPRPPNTCRPFCSQGKGENGREPEGSSLDTQDSCLGLGLGFHSRSAGRFISAGSLRGEVNDLGSD